MKCRTRRKWVNTFNVKTQVTTTGPNSTRETLEKSDVCSKLTIKPQKRRLCWPFLKRDSNTDVVLVFFINFEYISHLFLVLLLLTLNK